LDLAILCCCWVFRSVYWSFGNACIFYSRFSITMTLSISIKRCWLVFLLLAVVVYRYDWNSIEGIDEIDNNRVCGSLVSKAPRQVQNYNNGFASIWRRLDLTLCENTRMPRIFGEREIVLLSRPPHPSVPYGIIQ
jgi:hypothetical protein